MKKKIKPIITIILFFLSVTAANAQAALLVLIFGDKIATENFHLSIDAGMNFSSLPGLEQQKATHGLYFGLGTFVKLNEKWAITPEFKPLSPRGAKNVSPINDYSSVLTDVQYDIALNYIDVPILVQYKITPTVFVSAGPQFGFLTSAKQVSSGKLPLGNTVDIEENLKSNFESFNFSFPIEIGYTLSNLRKEKGVNIKLRYCIGMSEIISNSNYGSSKGSTFQVFFSLPFVK
jgi:hypothetical protein